MDKLFKYFDTIDKKAFLLTIFVVCIFIAFISSSYGTKMIDDIRFLMSKSHEKAPSADIYCAKKGNSNKAFCSDRRAAVNEKWKEVVNAKSDKSGKSSFSISR